jgi:hypothetical protein
MPILVSTLFVPMLLHAGISTQRPRYTLKTEGGRGGYRCQVDYGLEQHLDALPAPAQSCPLSLHLVESLDVCLLDDVRFLLHVALMLPLAAPLRQHRATRHPVGFFARFLTRGTSIYGPKMKTGPRPLPRFSDLRRILKRLKDLKRFKLLRFATIFRLTPNFKTFKRFKTF